MGRRGGGGSCGRRLEDWGEFRFSLFENGGCGKRGFLTGGLFWMGQTDRELEIPVFTSFVELVLWVLSISETEFVLAAA